jgi:hypothetical protein
MLTRAWQLTWYTGLFCNDGTKASSAVSAAHEIMAATLGMLADLLVEVTGQQLCEHTLEEVGE